MRGRGKYKRLMEKATPHDYRPDWIKLFSERESTKRNLPCPCGSGKKYKKCCGAAKENK